MVDEIIAEVSGAADETIRIPRNVMGLLRQSYDSREKQLDWIISIVVTLALAWAFRKELKGALGVNPSVNAGLAPSQQPNMDIGDAFPNDGILARVYTYNMPMSRTIVRRVGPSGTRPPDDPSTAPSYP